MEFSRDLDIFRRMIYGFGNFRLDIRRGHLRCAGAEIDLEPKVYLLLLLLVCNHDRLVSKDEIVEVVWDGRVVSDATISTCVRSLRRVLGDDGRAQQYVKTVRGRGFRFVASVTLSNPAGSSASRAENLPELTDETDKTGKPSIAVLPFELIGRSEKFSAVAEALPSELITSLSPLRWLSVYARGSTFRFRGPHTNLETVRSLLGARYCLSGVVEVKNNSLTVFVELVESDTSKVIWSESFPAKIDDIHDLRSQIANRTISALELHIPLHEADKARLKSPESLDAWGAYHLGLRHMFRFNRLDNDTAAGYFRRATELDPFFSRAFAARSFTSFQKAFLKYSGDVEREKSNARRFAEKSLELDPIEPFGNFTYGRAFWLEGRPDRAIHWLERAVELNPNFAQGYYAHGWTDAMAGRSREALGHLEKAIELSPLDPFLYGMQSARGIAYIHEQDLENGALWADKGARAPGAHVLIAAIAAAAHTLNNDAEKAKYWVDNVRARQSDATVDHFFTAFPLKGEKLRSVWKNALVTAGL